MVWAKAGDHASRTKAANGRSVAVIRSPCPGRQSFTGGKPRIKIAFEACGAWRFVSRRKANCYRLRRPLKVSRLSANPICLSPLIVLHPTLGLGVGGIGECAAD